MSVFDKIDDQLTDLYLEQNGFKWINGSECFHKRMACKVTGDYMYFVVVIVEPIRGKYIGNKKSKSPYRVKLGTDTGYITKYFYLDTITDFELYMDQFIKSLN